MPESGSPGPHCYPAILGRQRRNAHVFGVMEILQKRFGLG